MLIINSTARVSAEVNKDLGTLDLRDGNYSSAATLLHKKEKSF